MYFSLLTIIPFVLYSGFFLIFPTINAEAALCLLSFSVCNHGAALFASHLKEYNRISID
jgi:hypothetical protein